ncbi:hypothetical protein An09g01060 [Aspergillus niger]|uniref:Uncharacterized protein n=2 Tax=Aspergillus niger TaxID=5061 RepID=A2QT71_ASPNC|nr:hypothetical protein An09g01060 [Aspergillus niger]CAK49027.1 hypothetical protein An09g01060 [Aspergillus niger]
MPKHDWCFLWGVIAVKFNGHYKASTILGFKHIMYKMHTNIPYRHGHRSPRKLPVWGVLDRQGIRDIFPTTVPIIMHTGGNGRGHPLGDP